MATVKLNESGFDTGMTFAEYCKQAALDAQNQRDELTATRQRAEAAEATSFDIAAQAALDAQNWREELTATRQRAEAAEADRTTLRAQRDQWKNDAYAATARAAELEAKLAAVPVAALRHLLAALLDGRFHDAAGSAALIDMWLASAYPEAQP